MASVKSSFSSRSLPPDRRDRNLRRFSIEGRFGRPGHVFATTVKLRWGEHLFAGRNFGHTGFDTVETFRLARIPYETWLRAQFGDAVVDDGSQQNSVWGDFADPDKDGWSNVMEAAFGTDPQAPGRAPDVSLEIRPGISVLQSSQVVWRWHRAAEDQGVQLRPQWSPNLQQWYPSGEGPSGDQRTITATNLGPCHFRLAPHGSRCILTR